MFRKRAATPCVFKPDKTRAANFLNSFKNISQVQTKDRAKVWRFCPSERPIGKAEQMSGEDTKDFAACSFCGGGVSWGMLGRKEA